MKFVSKLILCIVFKYAIGNFGKCNDRYFPKSCGTSATANDRTGKIVGGHDAKNGEFPFTARIGVDFFGFVTYGCGGSLINERYVLTAAHCTLERNGRKKKISSVRLGAYDLKDPSSYQKDIDVEEVIPHEGFNPRTIKAENDIALIRLKSNVQFSAYVSPVCLPLPEYRHTFSMKPDAIAIAIGWGSTSNMIGQGSDILQKAELKIIDVDECIEYFSQIKGLQATRHSNVCTSSDSGKSQCNGDSGSALVVNQNSGNDSRYIQIGVASFGANTCDGAAPSVCTNVRVYLDWIKKNMKPFCTYFD